MTQTTRLALARPLPLLRLVTRAGISALLALAPLHAALANDSKPSAAQTAHALLVFNDNFVRNLDQHLQSLTADNLFSGTVLVAHQDKVIFEKGYGFANAEMGVPNAPNTVYRIASITKQFTAAGVLKLVDQKKLSLDDSIQMHLPQLMQGAPEQWRKVTVRQLLDHTSGIPSYTEFTDLRKFALTPQTPQNIVALAAKEKMKFEPGEQISYNNTAYVMAGLLIEKVSGKPYNQFVRDELLLPLGMRDSGYGFNATVIPRRAQGYSSQGAEVINAQHIDMSVPYSAGSLVATAADLLKWNRGLYAPRGPSRVTLLSPSSLAAMTDPGKYGYGLGLGVTKGTHGVSYNHTGGMAGVSTLLQYEPASELTIVVLSNFDFIDAASVGALISEYARRPSLKLAHQYGATATVNAAQMSRVGGSYKGLIKQEDKGGADKNAQEIELSIGQVDGALYAFPAGRPAERLSPLSATHYLSKVSLTEYKFEVGADGTATALNTQVRAQPIRLAKQPPLDMNTTPVYVRGSMNEWSTKHPLKTTGAQQWSVRLALPAGAHELKIATEDWRTIDLGAVSDMRALIYINQPLALVPRGNNLRLWIDQPGNYDITLDMSAPDVSLLRVTRVE